MPLVGTASRHGNGLNWLIFVFSIVAAALPTGALIRAVRTLDGRKKWRALTELLSLWMLPFLALLSAQGSGLSADATDHKIATLEAEQRSRELSSDDTTALQTGIARLPKSTIYLQGIQGDRESVRFANRLKPVFEWAGWSVNGVWEDGLVGGAGTGILVRQNPLATNLPGRELVEVLNKRGLHAHFIKLPDPDLTRFEVIVGARPE